jgi:hypothetical protein
MGPVHAEREQLGREIQGNDFRRLLPLLQRRNTFLRRFRTWEEVISFMRTGTSRDPQKDNVLLPILQAHAADRDPRWRTILLVIFWPGLESIWHRRLHWDTDPDALWANVIWAFVRTVCRLDPAKRSTRLVQKVINDVFHRVHVEYRSCWNRGRREIVTDPVDLAEYDVADEREAAAVELWVEQEARIETLKAHRAAGRIDDTDFLLLVGTQVYGRRLADCARESEMKYEAAKKRHQRAMKAIGGCPRNETRFFE